MSYYENALKMRPFLEKAVISLNDKDALNVPGLFKKWEIGIEVELGERYFYEPNKTLYKVRQAHTTQDNWTPDLTPAMWSVVTEEDGTLENPITAARNMEYEYGKYYKDPEAEGIFLCKSGESTGTIVLAYLPHELIGIYFERVDE